MTRISTRVGPHDAGRRMRLEEFAEADGQDGYIYELEKGVVVVTNVPGRKHAVQLACVRLQLSAYQLSHPSQVHIILGGSDSKILLEGAASERHPDISLYKLPPLHEEELWSTWVPELVIEIVSPGSGQRDYVEKRDDYFQFGVREYWILDAMKREMLVLQRNGGRWIERHIREADNYSPKLLPGLDFSVGKCLEAADAVPTPD